MRFSGSKPSARVGVDGVAVRSRGTELANCQLKAGSGLSSGLGVGCTYCEFGRQVLTVVKRVVHKGGGALARPGFSTPLGYCHNPVSAPTIGDSSW